MLKDHILALDFDGTCWDSIDERYYTTSRTFERLYGIDCSAVEECFKAGTHRAAGAVDFLWIMRRALENPGQDWEALSAAEIHELAGRAASDVTDFEKGFYAVRSEEQKRDFQHWASLQRPYAPLVAQFPALQQAFREVVVASAKDARSVAMLLETAGLKAGTWGKEHGIEKGHQLQELCSSRQIEPAKVVFIDDFLDNLRDAGRMGARCFMAGWGYNTAAERQMATREGFPVLELPNLLEQLEARTH